MARVCLSICLLLFELNCSTHGQLEVEHGVAPKTRDVHHIPRLLDTAELRVSSLILGYLKL